MGDFGAHPKNDRRRHKMKNLVTLVAVREREREREL